MTDPFVRPDVAGLLAFLRSVPGRGLHELEAPAAHGLHAAMRDMTHLAVGALATIADIAVLAPAGR